MAKYKGLIFVLFLIGLIVLAYPVYSAEGTIENVSLTYSTKTNLTGGENIVLSCSVDVGLGNDGARKWINSTTFFIYNVTAGTNSTYNLTTNSTSQTMAGRSALYVQNWTIRGGLPTSGGSWGYAYGCNFTSNGTSKVKISALSASNHTFSVDSANPTVTLLLPLNNAVDNNDYSVEFHFNVTDFSSPIVNCSLFYGTTLELKNTSITKNISSSITDSSVLRQNPLLWKVECLDASGKRANSSVFSLNTLSSSDGGATGGNRETPSVAGTTPIGGTPEQIAKSPITNFFNSIYNVFASIISSIKGIFS